MVLGKISHLTCGHKGQMQGNTPEPAGSWGRFHTLFIIFIYIWIIGTQISLFVFEITRRSRWPIRSYCSSKLYWVQIPVGSDVSHRGCAYTVLQTVQRHGVCSEVYGTVHYKEPLTLFDKCRVLSPFLLSRYCHDCVESNVQQYSLETTRA